MPSPRAAKSPARIQNRTMTVVSGQPMSSKWWWSGAIRNTRRWKTRKLMTWMTTDRVTITNRPPMMTSRRSRFISRQSAARPEPIDSDPVSPMKIFAGAAFHHRKPRHAPARATEASARSRASATW